jgi:gamma-glutamyltranspeptidase
LSIVFVHFSCAADEYPRKETSPDKEVIDHYSIVNQFGNTIAATTTLNAGYGSSITVMTWAFLE